MSDDLIKRSDAIKALCKLGHEVVVIDKLCSLGVATEFIDAIRAIPSADRPQGEWIDADGNFVLLDKDGCTTAPAWCSNCGEWLTGSDEYCTSGRFCPSCGARMKGADDETD